MLIFFLITSYFTLQQVKVSIEIVFGSQLTGTYKVRNEIETKRNETKRNQRKRNETKRNQQNRNETKRNQRNENEIKRNQRKQNEINENKAK